MAAAAGMAAVAGRRSGHYREGGRCRTRRRLLNGRVLGPRGLDGSGQLPGVAAGVRRRRGV